MASRQGMILLLNCIKSESLVTILRQFILFNRNDLLENCSPFTPNRESKEFAIYD